MEPNYFFPVEFCYVGSQAKYIMVGCIQTKSQGKIKISVQGPYLSWELGMEAWR